MTGFSEICPANIGPINRAIRAVAAIAFFAAAVFTSSTALKSLFVIAALALAFEAASSHCFLLGAAGKVDWR